MLTKGFFLARRAFKGTIYLTIDFRTYRQLRIHFPQQSCLGNGKEISLKIEVEVSKKDEMGHYISSNLPNLIRNVCSIAILPFILAIQVWVTCGNAVIIVVLETKQDRRLELSLFYIKMTPRAYR